MTACKIVAKPGPEDMSYLRMGGGQRLIGACISSALVDKVIDMCQWILKPNPNHHSQIQKQSKRRSFSTWLGAYTQYLLAL